MPVVYSIVYVCGYRAGVRTQRHFHVVVLHAVSVDALTMESRYLASRWIRKTSNAEENRIKPGLMDA
jgi:hypothetical protein